MFAELPKGGKSLQNITLNQTIGGPGGVQWDGKYAAIADQEAPGIYQFTVTGSVGMEPAERRRRVRAMLFNSSLKETPWWAPTPRAVR